MNLQEILNKNTFSLEEIIFLLELSSQDDLNLLFEKSSAIRDLYFGRSKNKVVSIEFSNYCENDCFYCTMCDDRSSSTRFRLTPDEILNRVNRISKENVTNVILKSGVDSFFDTDMISYIIYKIKQEHDVEITLDLLDRGFDEYRAWKFSGADNYLLKFNTLNSENKNLINNHDVVDVRIDHLKYLKRLSYKICTGNIIGLPNQTNIDIAKDLILLKQLNPEMIIYAPFIPKYLKNNIGSLKGNIDSVLKSNAICKILLKKSQMLVAASTIFYSTEEKKKLFEIGADTLMLESIPRNILKKGFNTKTY